MTWIFFGHSRQDHRGAEGLARTCWHDQNDVTQHAIDECKLLIISRNFWVENFVPFKFWGIGEARTTNSFGQGRTRLRSGQCGLDQNRIGLGSVKVFIISFFDEVMKIRDFAPFVVFGESATEQLNLLKLKHWDAFFISLTFRVSY